MRALDLKLIRTLWSMKGQGLAIAAVIAIGVAMYVMSHTMMASLRMSQESVYRSQHFADVFANLKRAPESVAEQLRNLPGVATLETRVQAPLNIQLQGYSEPITGMAFSIPDGSQPELNALFLRAGQLPEAWRSDQVVISEAFAQAHQLHPGDHLAAVINGRYQRLLIVGIALSPEFIYQIRPGDIFPDFSRYAIVWMNRTALESAFNMKGAFNSLLFSLAPGGSAKQVIAGVDQVLQTWGGAGAYSREYQLSHRYLSEELNQIATMALYLPLIFMGVAAFLLNVVTARLIRTQREQIAILKAFGYSSAAVMGHYLRLVMVIVAIGSVLGLCLGVWLAAGLAHIYQAFFRFPWLIFELQPMVAITAVALAGGAALLGTISSVYRAYALPPAEAMRPEPPPHYRRALLERLGDYWPALGLGRLSQSVRIVLRNIERQPVKAMLSVLGISSALALVMLSGLQQGAVNFMIDVQFRLVQKQDVMLSFSEPVAGRGIYEIAALPGVSYAESMRVSPVILRFGQREYRTAIQGYTADSQLFNVLNTHLQVIAIPPDGLLLTDHLAHLLGVKPGDSLQVSFQEGRRAELPIPVAGLVKEYVGVSAYMQQTSLNRLLREDDVMTGALLRVDPQALPQLNRYLQRVPRVVAVVVRDNTINAFNKMMGETIVVFNWFSMLMAGTIAFAVVYNNARIAFAERRHELSSLRILGFTYAETAYILLGELLLITLLALPLGFPLGMGLSWLLTWGMQSDLYRVPLVIDPNAYVLACIVVIVATLLSALVLIYSLARLDIVSALKAAE